ncbi:CD63 antigen [Nasonia vitripennis]|uniref:Tetraspanin n=1 Tax=Nasonia vitripennis TaxID=7425 RepID=A0A7M7GA53_NASVI|nr:CD63 antigen [Nasonia vitripennis]
MVVNLRLSTSSQLIKYLMFIFNLIFVITGIILLSIGSVIHGVYHDYQHFLDDRFFSVPSLLIAIGSIIFFIAFFGCCGAIKENYCMIVTFATLMVLVFILELSAGISGYVLRNDATEVLSDKMKKSMEGYKKTNEEIYVIWDQIQRDFECCGTDKPEDWLTELKNQSNPDSLPMSCCRTQGGQVGSINCTIKMQYPDRFTKGCLTVLADFVKGHAVQLGGAGIGIAFMQALGIWFSVYLARSIKRNYDNM